MSSATALVGVDEVTPVFLPEPQGTVPDTGVSDHIGTGITQPLDHAVQNATDHAVDAAMDQLHNMVVPALIGLSSLGGALLVGRAAMAGGQVLAAAAIRAAEDQAKLEQRQLDARQAATCWRDAAFAAARANARVNALRARIRRAGTATGPDGPTGLPGLPGLPPPLNLTGMTLDQVWCRLADTDRRLRRAEAAYARATMEAAGGPVSVPHPDDTDTAAGWHATLRARRRRALEEYEQAATEAEARARAPQPPRPATTAALTDDEVLRRGADLLAMLPRNVSAADFRFMEEKITSAAEIAARRPSSAKLHLREAARFAERLTREAERRQETEEWAAQRLAFLRDVPPDVPGPLPDATAEIAVLERVLDKGGTLEETERVRVEARVTGRVDAYQRAYAAEVIRAAVERSEPEAVTRSTSGTVQVIDWTPPGWGDEHWLRVSVDADGSARVATMHRDRDPAEETDADRDLDWRRCAEASRHLRELQRLAGQAGLSLPFVFDEPPERPVPREKTRSARDRDHRPPPRARRHDEEPR